MRSNPERLAWTVLVASFAIFCFLVVAVPLGVRSYLINATVAREALVESLEGTVVVEDPRGGPAKPVMAGNSVLVPEGSTIIVDEKAQAIVTFFDQSFIRLFNPSQVELARMRSPRFGLSKKPSEISIEMRGGRMRMVTVLAQERPTRYEVHSLQAISFLAPNGSYTIDVTNERTEVVAHRGETTVTSTNPGVRSAEETVYLSQRERTSVRAGEAPTVPLPAARDILLNGDLSQPLSTGWRAFNDQGGDGGNVDGTVTMVTDGGFRAVRFYRTGGEYNHCETIIEQTIDRDFPDPPTTLIIRANVKLIYQSLSGGGYQSSEYPLMIRLTYRDVYGSETHWVQGFYYQNLTGNPTQNGLQIPQGIWYPFDSGNLISFLPIVPYKIVSLRVYASGWNYESLVSDVSLIVE